MEKEKLKLNSLNILLLGTGFMVISMSWSLFNSYVPIFLKKYLDSALLIGFIMTLDNVAGMTIQPLISSLSDRTWTRNGRRMPYLTWGMPLAAVFFILLPLNFSVFTLMASVIMFDLSMSIFRGPTVALMPDLTPSPLRSKANGIINFMGGLGALLAYFLGSKLYEMGHIVPFLATSIIMIAALLLLKVVIKEPKPAEVTHSLDEGNTVVVTTDDKLPNKDETEAKEGILASLLKVFRDQDKSCLFLLCAIFFWFIGWNGIEAFFTTYGKFTLGLAESKASFLLGFFSLSFLVFAIPSGYIATKFGRKKTISFGLVGIAAVTLLLFIFKSAAAIQIIFLLGGLSWALININSYPMVVEMSGGNVGAYTGLYYFFSSVAAVIGPTLFGACMDKWGNSVIFVLGFIFMLIAMLFLSNVKSGEVKVAELQTVEPAGVKS